jgi:hypothetical protein
MVENEHGSRKIERRREPRERANHTALLTLPNRHPLEAWVLDVSSKAVRLRTPEPLTVDLEVRIDAEELLLFGTVTRCELIDGAYQVVLFLSRPLEMLDELQRLNKALLVESPDRVPTAIDSNTHAA